MNRTWLLIALVLSVILLSAHVYALSAYAYWHYWWLDIPMHILGGAALGAFLISFRVTRPRNYFLLMLCVVVGWEVFEYVEKLSTSQPNYWADTIGDMCNGLIGSGISYFLSKKTIWR